MLCCRAQVLQTAAIFLLNRDKKNFKAESTTLTRRSSERESRGKHAHIHTYMLLRINLSFHHMQLCDVICAARSLNTQHVSEVDCLRTRAVVDQ